MKNIKLEVSARYALACVLSTLDGLTLLSDHDEILPETFKAAFSERAESHFKALEGKNLIEVSKELFKSDESTKKLFSTFASNKEILSSLCKEGSESIRAGKIALRIVDQAMLAGDYIVCFSPEYMLAVQGSSRDAVDLDTEHGALEFSDLVNKNFKRYVEVPNAFQQDFAQFGDFDNKEMLEMCSMSLSQIIEALIPQGNLHQNVLAMLDAKMFTFVKLEST